MILKETDIKHNLEKYQQYGYQAEKQMAFYLKRAFQDSTDIFVINDLRLEMNDDVAQIDHLIVHRFGFIIVESKSVTSKISINEYGEWVRHYPKYTRGMPSPINQAKRQADFLKNFLMARSEYLLRKRLVFKIAIDDFKFDVLVAISDSGIINRAKNTDLPEVHKADQISDSIKLLLANYAGTNKNLLTMKVNYQFADSSMENITNYLLKSHTPKTIEPEEAKQEAAELTEEKTKTVTQEETDTATKIEKVTAMTCSKCKSENIQITYGRYGYYFKCGDCGGNSAIKLECQHSSCKPKISKKKDHFYKVCAACDTSDLYFINKPVAENVE